MKRKIASAAEELSVQAENLKDMVGDLVTLVNGARKRREHDDAAARGDPAER